MHGARRDSSNSCGNVSTHGHQMFQPLTKRKKVACITAASSMISAAKSKRSTPVDRVRRSDALPRDIQHPWPITCKNCCLCILLWTPFECRWSTRNCWDENSWFAIRVPSNRIADRTLDYIATVHCSKSYSSGKSQWIFYHLIPELVFDVNQIVLCCVCAENPMTKDQESILAGNNYGRLGSLKPLNGTTRN